MISSDNESHEMIICLVPTLPLGSSGFFILHKQMKSLAPDRSFSKDALLPMHPVSSYLTLFTLASFVQKTFRVFQATIGGMVSVTLSRLF